MIVLDEVDWMFDFGFIKDICYLMCKCLKLIECFMMFFLVMFLLCVCELVYEDMNEIKYVEIELF